MRHSSYCRDLGFMRYQFLKTGLIRLGRRGLRLFKSKKREVYFGYFLWLVFVLVLAGAASLPLTSGFYFKEGADSNRNSLQDFIAAKALQHHSELSPNFLAQEIISLSQKHQLDPILVAVIVKHESSFRPAVVSKKGAVGLMQLMPATAEYISFKKDLEWKGTGSLFLPVYNISLGVEYFHYLLDKYRGNRELALMAYNWGPGNLARAFNDGRSVDPFVRRYAQNVLSTHARWVAEFKAQTAC